MGENPMLSDPNLNRVKEGLENLEFLVVQDIFLTETAKMGSLSFSHRFFVSKIKTFEQNCSRGLFRDESSRC